MTSSSGPTKSATHSLPPDERFWTRYSPHHEALLSSVGSLTLHGLVGGMMILLGWAALWAHSNENDRPPNMDVIQLAMGNENAGGDPAPFGDGQESVQKEGAANVPEKTESVQAETLPQDLPKTLVTADELLNDSSASVKGDVDSLLKQIGQEAKRVQPKTPPPTTVNPGKFAGRKDGQVGKTGRGGAGGGTGTGVGRGSGSGMQGEGGSAHHKVYAKRWAFNPSGSGKEQAEKLLAARMILIVPHPFEKLQDGRTPRLFVIRDLRRRPAVLLREKADELVSTLRDSVYWVSGSATEVAKLARELRLPFNPEFLIIMVPEDREQQMASAEAEYAKQQNRPYDAIIQTWFDFRPRNGSYEPVVIFQK